MRPSYTALLAPFVLASGLLSAQTPEPSFEVASVKPNKTGSFNSGTRMPQTGRLEATNVTVQQLIVNAYSIRPFQVVDLPEWATQERFDVIGVPPSNAPPGQLPKMLAALLAERFGLVIRRETREQPVHTLVLASDVERHRTALKPTECLPATRCGFTISTPNGVGTMSVTAQSMADLAEALSGMVERTVVDRTALPGTFSFDLRYTPPDVWLVPSPDAPPSLFAALEEQLGLKLENARGPVEMLAIERVNARTKSPPLDLTPPPEGAPLTFDTMAQTYPAGLRVAEIPDTQHGETARRAPARLPWGMGVVAQPRIIWWAWDSWYKSFEASLGYGSSSATANHLVGVGLSWL